MAGRLSWFWVKCAYLTEGQQWLERALARSQASAVGVRAQTFLALGSIVFFQGDFERAYELLEQSAALAREACEPSIEAIALGLHTMAAIERGEFELGARLAVESAAAARAAGNRMLEGFSLSFFAYEALYAGDIDRAGRLHEEAVALNRAQGELWGLTIVLFDLALLRVVQHRLEEGRALCAEVIALGRQFRDARAIGWTFGVMAAAEFADGRHERAARILGASQNLLESIGSPPQPSHNALIGDHLLSALPQELGEVAYRQALADGRAMSMSQAIDYALTNSLSAEMSEFFPK
jgi:tetratricopeptide (TPR) repeat protein